MIDLTGDKDIIDLTGDEKCYLCDKNYYIKSDLNRHLAIHSDYIGMKYKCCFYKKSFDIFRKLRIYKIVY